MYLTDRRIRRLLAKLRIEADNPSEPFDAEVQIQPCSIDLRLSNVFWRPIGSRTVDLVRAKLMEVAPRRYWKRLVLRSGESITVKPGEMLLGRIYEKLTIPANCAGKIEGRSSFSRLGLSVHCTGDFLNPGYRGHMPLQLVNCASYPIRLVPYLPVCQLKLVDLGETPRRLYGHREIQSKYMDDDGGPSYWWRDKRIRALQAELAERDVTAVVQERLLEIVGPQEPDVLERFERFVQSADQSSLENAEALLEAFSGAEGDLEWWHKTLRALALSLAGIVTAGTLSSLLALPPTWLHYWLWVANVLLLPIAVYSHEREPDGYLTAKKIAAMRQRAVEAGRPNPARTRGKR